MKRLLRFIFILSTFSSCIVLDEKEFVLKENMCDECLQDVEKQLKMLEGIYVLEVSEAQISFRYDKEKIDVKALEKSLRSRNMLFTTDTLALPPVCCVEIDSVMK